MGPPLDFTRDGDPSSLHWPLPEIRSKGVLELRQAVIALYL